MLHQKDNVPGGPGSGGGSCVLHSIYILPTVLTACMYNVQYSYDIRMYVCTVCCMYCMGCMSCMFCRSVSHELVLNTVRMTVRMVVCIDGGFVSRRIWMYPFKYCIVPVLNVSGRER